MPTPDSPDDSDPDRGTEPDESRADPPVSNYLADEISALDSMRHRHDSGASIDDTAPDAGTKEGPDEGAN